MGNLSLDENDAATMSNWAGVNSTIADYAEPHYTSGDAGPGNGSCAEFVKAVLRGQRGLRQGVGGVHKTNMNVS